MGSPLSPIIADIFMEDFETKALSSGPPPKSVERFVDDTFVVIKTAYKDEFFNYINFIEEVILFNAENTRADRSMLFLDTLVTPHSEGSMLTTVYRKLAHTNQYLQWDSHHPISAKYSVISILFHRAKEVCSAKQHLEEEHEHLQKALISCKYPSWALNRIKKINAPASSKSNKNKNKNGPDNKSKSTIRKNHITVPYTKGLSESFKNICKKHGIQMYFKGGKTIKDLLVAPKDKDSISKKSGIIYRYKCDRLECDEEYIGESARIFGERYREHLKALFPIYDQSYITGHATTLDNFSIVGREDHNLMRLNKEAIYMRVNNPSLNRNIGKYQLPHIWDEVLNNITELKLK